MARPTKYSPEICEVIFAAIAQTGEEREGMLAAKISGGTFYAWKKDYPEFCEGIEEAKADFRKSSPALRFRLARDYLYRILAGEEEKVTVVTETGTSGGVPFQKTRTTRCKILPDRYVLESVLGPAISELEAIRVLVNAGYFPVEAIRITEDQLGVFRDRMRTFFNGVLPDLDTAKPVVLTQDIAAAVRSQILYPEGFEREAS
jgi:hypothetical protein